MTYSSLLEAYGWERFAADAQSAGATSLIIADLPAEEKPELRRVQLVAPTSTDERLRLAADRTDGWLYLVTVTGTTGARDGLSNALAGAGRAGPIGGEGHSALRRLRNLDSRRRAGGGRADRRSGRRLACARGGRGRPQGAERLRSLVAKRPRLRLSERGQIRRPAREAGIVSSPVWVIHGTRFRGFPKRQDSSTLQVTNVVPPRTTQRQARGTSSWGTLNRLRRSASASCCVPPPSLSPPPYRVPASPRTGRPAKAKPTADWTSAQADRRLASGKTPDRRLDVRQDQAGRRLDVEGEEQRRLDLGEDQAERRLDVAGQAERRLVELDR